MAGFGIGGYTRYYDPQTGITGTAAEHAAAKKKKQDTEAAARQAEQFRTQQQQQQQAAANQSQSAYQAGYPSAGAAGEATRSASNTSGMTGAGYSVDPHGYTSFNDDAEQMRRTAAAADARRMETLKSLMAQYTGSGTREAPPPTVSHRGLSVNGSEEAARAAAFGRAKDQTGQITRGAVDTLRNLYAGSGNVGAQRQGLENIVAGGAGALNEFTRDQLMMDLEREGQISDLTYSGGIQQRGQDINRPISPQLQALISLMGTLY